MSRSFPLMLLLISGVMLMLVLYRIHLDAQGGAVELTKGSGVRVVRASDQAAEVRVGAVGPFGLVQPDVPLRLGEGWLGLPADVWLCSWDAQPGQWVDLVLSHGGKTDPRIVEPFLYLGPVPPLPPGDPDATEGVPASCPVGLPETYYVAGEAFCVDYPEGGWRTFVLQLDRFEDCVWSSDPDIPVYYWPGPGFDVILNGPMVLSLVDGVAWDIDVNSIFAGTVRLDDGQTPEGLYTAGEGWDGTLTWRLRNVGVVE